MRLHFLGTGTPIGLGSRLQSCIALETDRSLVLLDFGMTAQVALDRAGIAPERVDAIVISHLHGDHFGGLPLLLLNDALRGSDRPLLVAGPPSTAERVREALAVFGWSRAWERSQEYVRFVTLEPGVPADIADLTVQAFAVPHNPLTEPTALRIQHEGITIAYSGDTGWTPTLLEVAADADLFICAVWDFSATDDASFLDYATLARERANFTCKRVILTHLGPEMLEHAQVALSDGFEVASDGLSLVLDRTH